ncbi:hypothetical protein EDB19DRAFT_1672974 [Suillus lakei]|nr:hypothetical protein EDB19DRAFT_1672974 [Suillus lakei]
MRLSFVLAIVAALTASMVVSADSECYPAGSPCSSDTDCCHDYYCMAVYDYRSVVALLDIQVRALMSYSKSCFCSLALVQWDTLFFESSL